ncbi:MAG: HU family DNA-binding protein [Gammaproteobacteria bacterium]|nr:HU family DNA-binding protein [Gammaproteobacteria bacterium]
MKRLYDKALMEQIAKIYGNEVTFLSEFSNALLDIIREGLIRDGQVRLHQFGTFKLKWMKSRSGINPSTGEKIMIQARPRVLFIPAKHLKEKIEPHPPALQSLDQAEDAVSADETVSLKNNLQLKSGTNVTPVKADESVLVSNSVLSAQRENDQPLNGESLSEPEKVISDIQDEIKVLEQVVSILKEEADGVVDSTAKQRAEKTNWLDQSVVEKIQEISELQYFRKDSELNNSAEPAKNSTEPAATVMLDIDTDTYSEKTTDDSLSVKKSSAKPWFAVAAAVLLLLASAVLFNAMKTDKPAEVVQQNSQASVAPMTPNYLYSYENELSVTKSPVTAPVHVPVKIIMDNTELASLSIDTKNDLPDQQAADDLLADKQPADSIVVSSEAYDELKRASAEQSVFFPAMEHKLMNGDSLWRLASKHYVNPFYWPHIYQANHSKIDNPDKVKIGRVINLPTLYGSPDDLTQQDKHNIAVGYYYNYLYHKGKGNPFAYFSLIGVEKFDPTLLIEYKDEIERADVNNLALLTI